MKNAPIKTASFLLFLLFAAGVVAQTEGLALDPTDPDLFPPDFFPGISEKSGDEIILAGLKSLYPQRILMEMPDPVLPDRRPPLVRQIGANGIYIRVKHLGEALPVISDHLAAPLVVIDLRFLATDLESTLSLGSLLTRRETLRLARKGDYPVAPAFLDGDTIAVQGKNLRRADQTVFTISNNETRGPIEALLAQLTNDADILSVGAPSPGQTGAFQRLPGTGSFFIISGDIRPFNGTSLIESGFEPRVCVRVDPDEERVSYAALRDEVSLDELVLTRAARPRDTRTIQRSQTANEENAPALPQDIVLQRALNIVKALQALGKIPD